MYACGGWEGGGGGAKKKKNCTLKMDEMDTNYRLGE